MTRCPKCGMQKVPSDRLDACGRPIERCPVCQGVARHSSRPADLTHPSLAGRSQVVTIEAPRAPVVQPRPEPECLPAPPGFVLRRSPRTRFGYVLVHPSSGRWTAFSARSADVRAVLEREVSLLLGESYAEAYGEVDEVEERPTGASPGPHPSELPSNDPRAVCWRRRIQRSIHRSHIQETRWTPAEVEQLRAWYATHSRGFRALPEFAAIIGRLPEAISRKAQKLGLVHAPAQERSHKRQPERRAEHEPEARSA
jgi:hypothetical protein